MVPLLPDISYKAFIQNNIDHAFLLDRCLESPCLGEQIIPSDNFAASKILFLPKISFLTLVYTSIHSIPTSFVSLHP